MLYNLATIANTAPTRILLVSAVLFAILCAIYMMFLLITRFPPHKMRSRRLELVESLNLDAKHKLALVKRDGQEHLILLAPSQNIIIETIAK